MSDEPAVSDSLASYEGIASSRRDSAMYREGYSEAERAFRIGLAVRERRIALGLSQVEVAARTRMTQPALSRLEAGGVIPTIPLLERNDLLGPAPRRQAVPTERRARTRPRRRA
jgi:ribosome-binding protein aMBF1 (putative translation factor)